MHLPAAARALDFGRLVQGGPRETAAAALDVALAFPRILDLALPWSTAWIAAALAGALCHGVVGMLLQVVAGAMMAWRLVRACAGRDGQPWHPDQSFAFMLRAVALCGAAVLALLAGIMLTAFAPGVLALLVAVALGHVDGTIPAPLLAAVRVIGLCGGLCAAALVLALGSDWVVRVALQQTTRDPFPLTLEHLSASLAEIAGPEQLIRRWRAWLWRVMVPFAAMATVATELLAAIGPWLQSDAGSLVLATIVQALLVLPAGLALAAACAERTLRPGLGAAALPE